MRPRSAPNAGRASTAVLPPLDGGLHCSSGTEPMWVKTSGALPPSDGGLHCGSSGIRPTLSATRKCSRRPTAGSIAAGTAGGRSRCRRTVLPPLSSGLHCGSGRPRDGTSTARVLPPLSGGLHCGPQTLTRMGPATQVLPPSNGGLHCGNVMNQLLIGQNRMLPPSNGGLHCARHQTAASTAVTAPVREKLSANVGISPLSRRLHCGAKAYGVISGANADPPAVQRRAPLRQPLSGPRGRLRRLVLSPSYGGLHCGQHFTGLGNTGKASAPAVQRRDPLRLCHPSAPGSVPDWCSRRRTAGSIAAGHSTRRRRTGNRVLPPFSGGLHCGTVFG